MKRLINLLIIVLILCSCSNQSQLENTNMIQAEQEKIKQMKSENAIRNAEIEKEIQKSGRENYKNRQ